MTNVIPKVSIVVNCFNGEEFLAEALDSIVCQTFTDWELLFWDNHSTDSSSSIFHSYDDPRFNYFYAPSFTTLAEARFLAINYCKAFWIGFIDCDDIWLPNKLELQVDALVSSELTNVGLIYGSSRLFGSSLNQNHPYHKNNCLLSPPLGLNPSIYTNPSVLSYRNIVGFCSALYRKDLIQELNQVVEFDLIPDYFWHLCLFAISDVLFVPLPLCSIRIHGSNLSTLKRFDMYRQSYHVLKFVTANVSGIYSDYSAYCKLCFAQALYCHDFKYFLRPFCHPLRFIYHSYFQIFYYFIFKLKYLL